MHVCVCVCFLFLKHHGSVPERKFGLEDGLTHEPSSLANEEMVEAALHWHGVHVKHFIPQVERHTENTWSTCQTLRMWRDILKHTEYVLLLERHAETHGLHVKHFIPQVERPTETHRVQPSVAETY